MEDEAMAEANAELFDRLQKRIDRMRPSERAARLVKLMAAAKHRPDGRYLSMKETLEAVALHKNVSVYCAAALIQERLADGSVRATGQRNGGPREPIPPSVFRNTQ